VASEGMASPRPVPDGHPLVFWPVTGAMLGPIGSRYGPAMGTPAGSDRTTQRGAGATARMVSAGMVRGSSRRVVPSGWLRRTSSRGGRPGTIGPLSAPAASSRAGCAPIDRRGVGGTGGTVSEEMRCCSSSKTHRAQFYARTGSLAGVRGESGWRWRWAGSTHAGSGPITRCGAGAADLMSSAATAG
jgi:hypothetical protein